MINDFDDTFQDLTIIKTFKKTHRIITRKLLFDLLDDLDSWHQENLLK